MSVKRVVTLRNSLSVIKNTLELEYYKNKLTENDIILVRVGKKYDFLANVGCTNSRFRNGPISQMI